MSAIATAEAFAPDDADERDPRRRRWRPSLGLPSCASTELTGLYGLELRAVTAAVNASILPIALRTASHVEDGVNAAGIDAPVMVMRGDGGATDLAGFGRARPARCTPARRRRSRGHCATPACATASSSRSAARRPTSPAVKLGRPALSYVQVARHATALRAVDVRVVGVAGGSMLRARRGKVYGVGPRSAHIAGLPYACFTDATRLDGARPVTIAPRDGDPADYVVLELGRRHPLRDHATPARRTRSAIPEPSDYCWADPAGARLALDLAGAARSASTATRSPGGCSGPAGEAVCELVHAVATSSRIKQGVDRRGRRRRRRARPPRRADAGLRVRGARSRRGHLVDRRRAVAHPGRARAHASTTFDPAVVRQLAAEVEDEVVAAGAAPTSVEVLIEEQPDKGTVRAVATGAIGLQAGARPGRPAATEDEVRAAAAPLGGGDVRTAGSFWLAVQPTKVLVLDRFGDPAADITGAVANGPDEVAALVDKLTKYRGPVTLKPSVWVIDGAHLMELSSGDVVASAEAVVDESRDQTFIVGRS